MTLFFHIPEIIHEVFWVLFLYSLFAVSFYAMLNQLHPALTPNEIKLEPQHPTSRQLQGHASMQVLGRFWILACSFTSTERN